MPSKSTEVNKIKKEVTRIKQDLKKQNKTLEALTTRLAELEVYSSSSEEELPQLKEGDRVKAITNPNKNRTGVVTEVQDYWVTVKADWAVVQKSGRKSKHFTKAKHNLELIEQDEQQSK